MTDLNRLVYGKDLSGLRPAPKNAGPMGGTVVRDVLGYKHVAAVGLASAVPAILNDPRVVDGLIRVYGAEALVANGMNHVLGKILRGVLLFSLSDDAGARQAAAGIVRAHEPVKGALAQNYGPFPAGTRYSGLNPPINRLVLGKAVYGIGQAAQLLVLPEGTLVKAADTIYAQCGPLASAFRAAWPSGSFNELVGEIYNAPRFVRPEAKAVMSRALTVKIDDAPDWAILALGLAGEQTRADYGVKWGFSQKRKFSKTAAKVRELIAKAPPVVKYWPNAAQLARA